MVVIFHYASQEGAAAAGSATAHLQRAVAMCWTGVDLFFVLSGFLIGGILIDERCSSSFFRAFYARRFFRIIPIYFLWITLYIALVVCAGSFLTTHAHSGVTPKLGWPIYIHYFFLQNFGLFSLAGLAGAWFGPTWSLAIEEQFYLIAPAIIRLVSPRRLLPLLIATIVAIPIVRTTMLWAGHPSTPTDSTLMICRGDELAIGMLAARLWRRAQFRAWAAAHTRHLHALFILLVIAFASLWRWMPQSGMPGMQSVGFTVVAFTYATILFLAVLLPSGPIATLARLSWLRALGKISYCVYIIHVAVNVMCHAMLLHETPRVSTPKGLVVSVFAACLTCALATVSWFSIEHPLLRFGHKFRYEDGRGREMAGSIDISPTPPHDLASTYEVVR